jgi:hypothetical protein
VSELLQNFTEYAGFLTLEELLTWEDGVVQASSKSSVLMVLQNNLFKVKDMEEATDKFDVGVKIVDNNAVEGVDAATVWERFDSLPPFLAIFQATDQSTYREFYFFFQIPAWWWPWFLDYWFNWMISRKMSSLDVR